LSAALLADDVLGFRDLVGRRLGLRFEDSRLGPLAETLQRRLAATRLTAEHYLRRLATVEPGDPEVRALAQDLTVGETYFFRNHDQFRALAEVALPERIRARSDRRRLSVLSAGCATGEEPFSLAMVLADRVDPSWSVTIRAVDANPAALARASAGRYSAWSLRETAPEAQRRWFRPEGGDFVLDEGLRRRVEIGEGNLAEDDAALWATEAYDVVFCRNVVMYFTGDQARRLVARIARALAPGGYLFLGHAETLRGLSHEFHLLHTHGTFYYQRRAEPAPLPAREETGGPLPGPPSPTPAATEGGTWVETIRRAAARIDVLAHSAATGSVPVIEPASGPEASRWDLGDAVDLLRAERYADALQSMERLPREASDDPDVLLLRATLLTQSGQLEAAEHACERILAIDDLSAGAHYLRALCREGRGDREGAIRHDQMAAYLDPGFAMPRLHLGLMARRGGDRAAACRELGQALELLRGEEASRLLLFGGGFSREALVTLCRAEYLACGGQP
jgi:chemotaxis protein methyltransferase CheR